MVRNPRSLERREHRELVKIREQDLNSMGSLRVLSGLWSRSLRLSALFSLVLLSRAAVFAEASRAVVTWQPETLVNGSPVIFQIRGHPNVRSITAIWLGHNLTFFRPGASRTWYALAGIPVETAPGKYALRISEAYAAKSAQLVTTAR